MSVIRITTPNAGIPPIIKINGKVFSTKNK